MRKQIPVITTIFSFTILSICLQADIPQLINFQGVLFDGEGNPLTGTYEITFRIYDVEEDGTPKWTETDSVSCKEGLYSTILGLIIPINLPFDTQYWLSVQVTGDDELSPRYRLVSVPTAFRAQVANQVSWTNLTDVPIGFSDGIDDIGEAGGISQVNAGTCVDIANPTGPIATVSHAADASSLPHAHHTKTTSASELTFGKLGNARLNMGHGNGIDADMVDGHHASDFLSTANDWGRSGVATHLYEGTSQLSDKYVNEAGPEEMTGNSSDPILKVTNTGTGRALWGESSGYDAGMCGTSNNGYGVFGDSNSGWGVFGRSNSDNGVHGASGGDGSGVFGYNSSTGPGVYGESIYGNYAYLGSPQWAGYFHGKTYISGNVGIGTESPDDDLHVADHIRVGEDPSYSSVYGEIKHDGGGTGFKINANANGGWADMHLQTDGTTRVFIESGGNVGIGTTSPDYKLDVNGTIRGSNVSPSDIRLKKEIATIENAFEKVASLRGIQFRWVDAEISTDLQIGVIAQEVESVFPEAVSMDAEGYKSVAYGRLIAPLIEAVKELRAENEELRKEIEELKNVRYE